MLFVRGGCGCVCGCGCYGSCCGGCHNRGISDGLLYVDSLEGCDQCLDFCCVNANAGCSEDGCYRALCNLFASRVKHHCTVYILHIFHLLYPNRALRPAAASSSETCSGSSSTFCSACADSTCATCFTDAAELSLAAISSLVY